MARKYRNSSKREVTRAQHSFAQIPSANIPRSVFNRSCGLKSAFDVGDLIPIFCDEALPGDTMSMRMTHVGRLATLLHPIMDNVYVETFWFAVPCRLLWQNWEKFHGAQDNPGDSTDFLVPTVTVPGGGFVEFSLHDYLGIPPGVDHAEVTALFHRAYNLIWNEWFRDENLQASVAVPLDDGPDSASNYNVLKRGKRHDYFTSSLPWPQKGPAVSTPLGTTAPLTITGNGVPQLEGVTTTTPGTLRQQTTTGLFLSSAAGSAEDVQWVSPALTGTADLSNATAATINQLREAFAVQKLFERDARGGTRYTEILRSHFGVTSPDQRLQRPEYLGGCSTTVGVQQVASSAEIPPNGFVGDLGAFGQFGDQCYWTKSFVEHCVVIGLVSVRGELYYQQGLDRMFSRRTRFDYYWPALAHLGEQAVLNKEIFADGSAADEDVFGYQERFAEYRYKPSRVSGAMRSSATQSLDTWHLAQDFANLPVLGDQFIEEDPAVDRVVAVPSLNERFIYDAFFEYRCARPMPVYGVPGQIDRF